MWGKKARWASGGGGLVGGAGDKAAKPKRANRGGARGGGKVV